MKGREGKGSEGKEMRGVMKGREGKGRSNEG